VAAAEQRDDQLLDDLLLADDDLPHLPEDRLAPLAQPLHELHVLPPELPGPRGRLRWRRVRDLEAEPDVVDADDVARREGVLHDPAAVHERPVAGLEIRDRPGALLEAELGVVS
jgi:hypothetical protein